MKFVQFLFALVILCQFNDAHTKCIPVDKKHPLKWIDIKTGKEIKTYATLEEAEATLNEEITTERSK